MFDNSKYRFNLTIFQEQKVKDILVEFLKKKKNSNAGLPANPWADPCVRRTNLTRILRAKCGVGLCGVGRPVLPSLVKGIHVDMMTTSDR